MMLRLKMRSQCRMGLLNGPVAPLPKDLPDQTFLSSLTERSAVQQITHFTLRSVDRSAMALCGCSLPHVSAIAAPVRSVSSVKNPLRPSKHDGLALFSGHSLPPPQHLMSQPPVSQPLLTQCFGEIGSAVRSGDAGSICCARKPFCSPLARFSM